MGAIRGHQYGPRPSIQPDNRSLEECKVLGDIIIRHLLSETRVLAVVRLSYLKLHRKVCISKCDLQK